MDGRYNEKNGHSEGASYPNELVDNAKLEEYLAPLDVEPDNYLLSSFRLGKFYADFSYNELREPVNKTDWLTHCQPAAVSALYTRKLPLKISTRSE